MLILFRGLPGTGKTTLIQAVSKQMEVIVLSRDELRAQVIAKPNFSEDEKLYVDSIIYSAAQSYLMAGERVIIDGMPFKNREKIDVFLHFAITYDIPWRIVECYCSEVTAESRILEDLRKRRHVARDRTLELYHRMVREFRPIPYPRLMVNTDLPVEQNVQKCLGYFSRAEKTTANFGMTMPIYHSAPRIF